MSGLHLGDGLDLPVEAVTETFAIIAKRGKGKTYTAAVLAEEMIRLAMPVVVIDPVGVWWGLRASADGTSEGLPVVIFGGDHADVPLEEKAGELIADILVDQRFPAVIDLSSLSKSAARRFMAPFIERLYHRNREAMHIIIDEADAFAPQRTTGEGARLLGAMEDLVRRGRARGLGITLVTQRPAVINKDVLTQAEVLVALGMTGPRDVAAIDEWVKLHADEDQAREVKASLPSLPVGTAWVWSPGWLDILQKVKIRPRRTFDSSATPKPGERRTAPKQMADVDLAALGEQISATVERAKADDPKVLRAELAQLRSKVAQLENRPDPEPERVEVEVPALSDSDREVLTGTADTLVDILQRVLDQLQPVEQIRQREVAPTRRAAIDKPPRPAPRPPTPRAHSALTGPMQRVVDAIAWLEAVGFPQPTKIQTGFIAGYRVGKKVGGTYGNILGSLRSEGLLDYPSAGTVELTDAGRSVATPADIEQTTEGLQHAVYDRLADPERRVLEGIVQSYPEALTKQEAGEYAGYTVGPKVGGTFGNILGRLRSLGLIDYPSPGYVVATDLLFLDAS